MSSAGHNEPKLVQAPPRRTSVKRGASVTNSSAARPTTAASASPAKTNGTAAAGSAASRSALPPRGAHKDPQTDLTSADASEGTSAFKNRVSEITSFKVVSRVRPFIEEELAEMEGQERRSVVEMTGATTILLDPKDNWGPKAQFAFDASLWSIPPSHKIVHTFQDTRRTDYATQKDVYNVIAKDLVPHVFEGFNSCVLTYGQTGSGKTYTMMGNYDPDAECGGDGDEGIIPRVSNDLFLLLKERKEAQKKENKDAECQIRVEVSFVEIYMERVRDLLDPALKHTRGNEKLQDGRIRQDPFSGPFVEGVTKYQVENWAQCCALLERGSQHRTTCATAVHNQSSRSHAIYQITVMQEQVIPAKDRFSRPTTKTLSGRINLVDLAGSERGGFQDYVKESAAINTSLLALRRVIDNLTERQNLLIEQARAEITGEPFPDRAMPQVPFRDSILTWLLSDSIGGNARTTMVATLSPLVKNYGDTLATLQWSSKARNLVTLVKKNDQTVVQEGMQSRAGELGDAVRIQRQNLDSLRETLQYKKQTAERFEKEARTMEKAIVKEKTAKNDVERVRAAGTIQRAYREHRHREKLRVYDQNKERVRAALIKNDQNMQKLDALREQAEKKEEDTKAKLAAEQERAEELATKAAEVEAEKRPVLNSRREAAEAQRAAVREELHADDICNEHKTKVEADAATAKAELEAAKAAKAEREAKLASMKQKIADSKTDTWKQRVAGDEEDLSALRAKRDALKVKHAEVSAQHAEVKAKHAKAFKK